MSEEVRERGKLKLMHPRPSETQQQMAKRFCEYLNLEEYFKSYEDAYGFVNYFDILNGETSEYMILKNRVYKMIDFELLEWDVSVTEHNNGNIDFDVTYYNGGGSLGEVIEGALDDR